MHPVTAARVIAVQLLGRDPNRAELAWVQRVIQACLPRTHDPDATPIRRVPTNPAFPPPYRGEPRLPKGVT